MNEVAQRVSSGGTPRSGTKEFYNGSIPWLRTQDIDYRDVYKTSVSITEAGLNSSSAKWVPENSVIVAMYGATAAKVAVNKIPLTTNQACCNITVDSNIAHYRYVYHWIAKQYFILKNLGEGSQNNLNARKIKNFPIPVPPLEEQQRIVNILDKFDALVNDLTSGLPAEIEARRKQYEFYRDQLLTFKELSA
nr:restriction endonuclease subunit S [Corynebacterium sp. 5QC2CO]